MIPGAPLPVADDRRRVKRDRLELITALIHAPTFDALYRSDVIELPARHPVYGWVCPVEGCGCVVRGFGRLCAGHERQWHRVGRTAVSFAEFVRTATPIGKVVGLDPGRCMVCRHRPARYRGTELCDRHLSRWRKVLASEPAADLQQWSTMQEPFPTYGDCSVVACHQLAVSPIGLCLVHRDRYRRDGSPGGARLASQWLRKLEGAGRPVMVIADDELGRVLRIFRVGRVRHRSCMIAMT